MPPDAYEPDLARRIASCLERASLFGDLDARTRASVAGKLAHLTIRGGTTLFRAGDPGDALYIVLSGRLAVQAPGIPQPHLVAELGADDLVGEMSLMTGDARSAHVVAGDDLVLLEVTKAALAPLLARRPEVVEEIGRIMAERKVGLEQARGDSLGEAARRAQLEAQTRPLVARIRRFLGV